MSEDRLIILKRPQHHKYRLVAAVAVCGLGVAGVWGWQMKTTFERYAADRAAQGKDADQTLTEVGERLELQSKALEVKNKVEEIQALMDEAVLAEMSKEQALEAVKAQTGESIDTPPSLPLAEEEGSVN